MARMTRWMGGVLGAAMLIGIALAGFAGAQGEVVELAVAKEFSPENPGVGEDLTYTVTVTNNGDEAVASQMIDTLPQDVDFVSVEPGSGGECSRQQIIITCTVPELGQDESFDIVIVVKPKRAGAIINVASVNAGLAIDTNPQNNIVTTLTTVGGELPVPVADLEVTKSADPDPAIQGQPLTYTVEVANHGPDPATARVVDTLPPNATFVDPPPEGCTRQALVLTCTLEEIPAGETVELEFDVTPQTPGALVNAVTVLPNELAVDTAPLNNLYILITLVEAATSPGPTTPSPTTTTSPSPEPPTSPSPTVSASTPVGGIDTGAGGTTGVAWASLLVAVAVPAGIGTVLFLIRRRARP